MFEAAVTAYVSTLRSSMQDGDTPLCDTTRARLAQANELLELVRNQTRTVVDPAAPWRGLYHPSRLPARTAECPSMSHFAAGQPVGEPVAWKYRAPGVSFWRVSFRKPVNPEWECEPLYAAQTEQVVDLAPATIPDTPEVREILGRPNFWCSPWANVLRRRGDVIPCKAEEEQAAVIRFMLNHYLAHGARWAEAAEAELQAIRYQVKRND